MVKVARSRVVSSALSKLQLGRKRWGGGTRPTFAALEKPRWRIGAVEFGRPALVGGLCSQFLGRGIRVQLLIQNPNFLPQHTPFNRGIQGRCPVIAKLSAQGLKLHVDLIDFSSR